MLQTNGAVNDVLDEDRPAGLDRRLAVRPEDRDLDADGHHHLEVHRLRGDPLPRRPAEHPRGALRGGGDRRRDATGRSSGASRCRCSARRSGSGRSCRSSARCSSSTSSTSSGASTSPSTAGTSTMATYMVVNGRNAGELRLRQRRRRGPVHHLARRRADLPALRAAPRHRGRTHGRKEVMATTTAPPLTRRRRARAAGGKRPSLSRAGPATYFVAWALVGLCIAPGALHHHRRLPHERRRSPSTRPASRRRGSSSTTPRSCRARPSGARSATP